MAWKYSELSPDLQRRIREASVKKTEEAEPPPVEVPPPAEPDEEPPIAARVLREENKLTVWMKAIGAPRQARSDAWKPSSAVQRYRKAKDTLRPAVPPDMLENVCGVDYVAYFERSKSWTVKRILRLAGRPHEFKPDADNVWKFIVDCLFPKDEMIYKGAMEKRWDDGKGPRIELTFHYKMKPTYTVFRERVQRARDEGKLLRLEGYYSADSQKVSDMTIRLLPEGGYDQLVLETLRDYSLRYKELRDALLTKYGADTPPGFVQQCMDEQVRAWEKRAGGEAAEKSSVLGLDGLEDSGKGYHTKPSDPFLTVILGAYLESEEVRSQSKKEASTKVGKTMVKNSLKYMLPLGKFRGRLNLDLDNVDDVQVIED